MSGNIATTIIGGLLSTNLLTVGVGAPLLAQGASATAADQIKKPTPPPLLPATEILRRLSGQARREGPAGSLTGQIAPAGQPISNAPSLLGG